MKNFTYRLRSKKAYTLVELVVTIAILSITAGFGIGIFASALRNYSSASVTAKDQETALAVESFIVKNARTAKDIYFLNSDFDTITDTTYKRNKAKDIAYFKTQNLEGAFITHTESDGFAVRTSYLSKAENMVGGGLATNVSHENTVVTYSNLSSITFRFMKQYNQPGNDAAGTTSVLYYSIRMDSGYILSGSVIMFNCTSYSLPASGSGDFSNYVVSDTPYTMTIIDSAGESFDQYDNGVAFIKSKEV